MTIVQLGKNTKNLWATLKQRASESRQVLLTASGVAGIAIVLRLMGLLQESELAAVDRFFRWRPPRPTDERILIVGIDETDLQALGNWPIPDETVAELLQKIQDKKPRAIGLDIYRDLPVEPGHDRLIKTMSSIPNLVGIERIAHKHQPGVPPPLGLSKPHQVGFNNVVIDSDGKLRRGLLYWHVDGKPRTSFALQLALIYLRAEGISERPAAVNPNYLQLGKGVFRPFKSNDGAYVRADRGGYQFLADFAGPVGSFRTVSLTEVLENKVPPELFRDRIVLIGSVASSLKDFLLTPYSDRFIEAPQPISGVEVQANFISHILNIALTGQPILNVWPDPVEWLWIFCWSCLGTSLSWKFRSPKELAFSLVLAAATLTGGCYLAFFWGWWFPLIPPLLTMTGSAIVITSHLAHLKEELKRSKEFLHGVIDTIPDPIFVKDTNHRWIVLNQAYCQFVGYSRDALIEKSEYDVFPKMEAERFWQHDEQILIHNLAEECEEEFTDAAGNTHLIATKRSLHKDAAGNVFLVGVIRDITERKLMEVELKRVAAELERSNAELKLSQDRFRHQAYHDALTGLPNRKLFSERLSQAIEWADSNDRMVALLFLDLDGFKQINDTLGHDIGDLLLKGVAKRLTGSLRGSDTVARIGGDEFTIVLLAIPSVEVAARVARKILAMITPAFEIEGHTLCVTTSIGIGLYPLHADRMEDLLKKADSAMYRAKECGKNRYEFSSNPTAS